MIMTQSHPLNNPLLPQVSFTVNPLRVTVSNKVNTRSTSDGVRASASGAVEMDANVVQRAMRYEPYYWRLPPQFNGDKVGIMCMLYIH